MELHWENLDKEEMAAIVAPGVWLKFIKRSSGEFIYVYLTLYSVYNGYCHLTSFGGTNDKTVLKLREEYCMKYASIIASSYLGQQHPYRDYPKNL